MAKWLKLYGDGV